MHVYHVYDLACLSDDALESYSLFDRVTAILGLARWRCSIFSPFRSSRQGCTGLFETRCRVLGILFAADSCDLRVVSSVFLFPRSFISRRPCGLWFCPPSLVIAVHVRFECITVLPDVSGDLTRVACYSRDCASDDPPRLWNCRGRKGNSSCVEFLYIYRELCK